jgi:hypothetical protein
MKNAGQRSVSEQRAAAQSAKNVPSVHKILLRRNRNPVRRVRLAIIIKRFY